MASLLANSEYIATVNSKLILCKAIKMKFPDYAKRFKRLWSEMPDKPKNQKLLAKVLDCSQATVSDWVNGEKLPAIETAIRLCDLFGCCVEYLLTGKGPKLPTDNQNSHENCINISKLTGENRTLVELMVEKLIQSQSVEQPIVARGQEKEERRVMNRRISDQPEKEVDK